MMRKIRIVSRWLGWAALAAVAMGLALLNLPQLWFPHHVSQGRLTLYSDRPFDAAKGRAVLADAERRIAASALDDGKPYAVAVANAEWRRRIAFVFAGGASGVNRYPFVRVVYLRHSDIDADRVFGASGRPAAPPRTMAYYVAHEICHSLTAARLGPLKRWNYGLPQWVREGTCDYVGLGGEVDSASLYARYRAGDRELSFARSGTYARFRMLAAHMLQRRGWTVDQLLASKLSLDQAQALMDADMRRTH